jgi:hypothetical protein
MSDRAFGPVHHFIGTDHPITAQVQKTGVDFAQSIF